MRKLLGFVLISGLLAMASTGCSGKAPKGNSENGPAFQVGVRNRLRLQGSRIFRGRVLKDRIHARYSIPKFYRGRAYRVAWINDFGPLARARALLEAIDDSESHGLNPSDFHQSAIHALIDDFDHRKQLEMAPDIARLADLEILLTDAYLRLANQYYSGKVRPKVDSYEWYIPRTNRKNFVTVLQKAIDSDTVSDSLKDLLPKSPDYWRLRDALAQYRKIAAEGGWKLVPPGPNLRNGDEDRRVLLLRRRLLATHDFVEKKPEDESDVQPRSPRFFDDALEEALKHFQERNGIRPDGVLTRRTTSALNVSVGRRIRQIELNLERWRWLPRSFGARYIAVNIANFELRAVKGDSVELSMPVVVGNQYRQTPVFTGLMSYVVLNPYWFVPKDIVLSDLLRKLRRNPAYLGKKHLKIVRKSEAGEWEEVDPQEIDWNEVTDETMDFNLRQDPGPANPLGKVKFMFPNRFSIYLHDTNEKGLFRKGKRSLSSGCIRLSHPIQLLKFVLEGEPGWDMERVSDELKKNEETEVQLKHPIPVLMLYQTAWADASGEVEFRPDLYNQDELLDEYL